MLIEQIASSLLTSFQKYGILVVEPYKGNDGVDRDVGESPIEN